MTLRELTQDWRESGGDAIDCAIMLENWIKQAEATIDKERWSGEIKVSIVRALLGTKEKTHGRP